MAEFRATYRLQLTPDFGFAEARQLVPYLRDLGISHLYLSPSLQARAGSQHGYDVTDPRHISPELGGEEEFRKLATSGLGVILDIVPNHMLAGDESPFWRDERLREMVYDVDLRTGFHRRFFDIGELGGVKQEDWEVFWATHAKVIELARAGLIDGVRVDHPDGLADPEEYFERLRDAGVRHAWAEKIVEPGEELRDWAIEGTTGYEFLNDVMALFVDDSAESAFTELYHELTGDTRRFEDIAALSKLEVAVNTFEPELRRLHEEVEVDNLPLALSSFHVYRTYIRPDEGVVDEADRAEIGRANVSEELRRILFLQEPRHDEFVIRFQQTTGPVMAKGVEDTAFYRYFRLAALNEVGGNPGRFGMGVDEFHAANAKRGERFPLHLLTTYTHDTKRAPDVRARIVALTWLADRVARARARLARATGRPRRRARGGARAADARRRAADRPRSTRRLPAEGAPRGEGDLELADARRGARARRAGVRRASGGADRVGSVPRRGARARTADRSGPGAAEADGAGRAGHLPRRRARGSLARRPGQPPAGRLGRAPCSARCASRAAPSRPRKRSSST